MNSTEIPFVNYVFITITAGVLAFVTLMDEGTVVNEETTIVPIVDSDTPTDIFSSVSANDDSQSALNSLPSIFASKEDAEVIVPEPEPVNQEPFPVEGEPVPQDSLAAVQPEPLQPEEPIPLQPATTLEENNERRQVIHDPVSQQNNQAQGGNKTKGYKTIKHKKKRTIKRK